MYTNEQLQALVAELSAEALPTFSKTADLAPKILELGKMYQHFASVNGADGKDALASVAEVIVAAKARHDEIFATEQDAETQLAASTDSVATALAGLLAEPAAPATPAEPVATDLAPGTFTEVTPDPAALPQGPENAAVETGVTAADATERVAAGGIPAAPAAPAAPRPSLEALLAAGPDDTAVTVSSGIQASSNFGLKVEDDSNVGLEELAAEFASQHTSMQVLQRTRDVPNPLGGQRKLGVIRHDHNGRTVFAAEHPGATTDELVDLATKNTFKAMQPMVESIKAAGGPCAQLESDYSILLSGGKLTTSFISTLPSVVNNREMSIYPWKKFSMGSRPAAATTTVPGNFNKVTTAQDTLGYYPGTLSGSDLTDAVSAGLALEKGCVRIDCPSATPLHYHAIYQCLTIGNMINISFPEYVSVWKEFMATHFQISREEDAIATVMAAARIFNVTGDIFGANRDLFSVVARFVSSLRVDRHDPNLPISLYFPSYANPWLQDDWQKQMFHNDDRIALQMIASMIPNLNIGFYDVSAGTTTAGSPTVLPPLPSTAGTTTGLQTWPSQMRVIAFPTGAVFQQKVGDLSFGLRETGMATNDFSMFKEIFEATHIRGDVYALDVKLCPQGEAAGSSVVSC